MKKYIFVLFLIVCVKSYAQKPTIVSGYGTQFRRVIIDSFLSLRPYSSLPSLSLISNGSFKDTGTVLYNKSDSAIYINTGHQWRSIIANITASNGNTKVGNDIRHGGTLSGSTALQLGGFSYNIKGGATDNNEFYPTYTAFTHYDASYAARFIAARNGIANLVWYADSVNLGQTFTRGFVGAYYNRSIIGFHFPVSDSGLALLPYRDSTSYGEFKKDSIIFYGKRLFINGKVGGSDATKVIIDSAGNLGIGVTPTAKLHVSADALINSVTAGVGSGNGSGNTTFGNSALSSNTSGGINNTALGFGALALNTTGDGNTAIGNALGANTTGSYNTSIGLLSLSQAKTASYNTAIGYQSMRLDTTGGFNTAIGANTLGVLKKGDANTIIGYDAGGSMDTATGNTAIGYNALNAAKSEFNAVGGYRSGQSITSGYDNTAWGAFSLAADTSGYRNVAVGNSAMQFNKNGNGNVAVGTAALQQNTTGSSNIAIGDLATPNNTTGSTNIGIGYNSLPDNISGKYNIAIGSNAGKGITSGDSSVFIGTAPATGNPSGRSKFIIIRDGASNLGFQKDSVGNITLPVQVIRNDTTNNKILVQNTSTGMTSMSNWPTLVSGLYTPTLTNTTNISASTAYQCQYMRVGNVVTVSGRVDIDPVATSTDTELRMSLPYTTNFGNTFECGGVFSSISAGVLATGGIPAVVGTSLVAFKFTTVFAATNQSFSFSFTFLIPSS